MTEPTPTQSSEGEPAARTPGLHAMVQHYLPNLIYGANDGIVTTLAVMSGVTGAALSNQIVLILGFASLFADGFSMGSSEYLSSRSEPEAEDRPPPKEAAKHGGATFAGFITAGVVPLLAYVLPWFEGQPFVAAVSIAMVTLFGIGASRAFFTDRGWLRAGLEMLLIGALAAGVAYGIGALGSSLTGGRQP